MMARDRAVTTPEWQALSLQLSAVRIENSLPRTLGNATLAGSSPSITFIPAQDQTRARPSLDFQPITRTLPYPDYSIRVGRYSEREHSADVAGVSDQTDTPIGFKSKVVSRRHCEFFYNSSQWYIKDIKSSSGTFLNHVRLSGPGIESKPFPINDGDIVQLGIDFKGGEETMFRCVKMRIETNRTWQKGLNKFNKSTHRQLQQLAKQTRRELDRSSKHSTECTICLNPIAPCQALFVAPCSHTWHYKCIKTVLDDPKYPHFLCPNCRAQADLSADVDERELQDYEEFYNGDEIRTRSSTRLGLSTQELYRNDDNDRNDQEQASHGDVSPLPQDIDMNEPLTSDPSLEPSAFHHTTNGDRSHSTEGEFVAPFADHTSAMSPNRGSSEVRHSHEILGNFSVIPIDPSLRMALPPIESTAQTAGTRSVNREPIENIGPLTPRNAAGPFILNGSA